MDGQDPRIPVFQRYHVPLQVDALVGEQGNLNIAELKIQLETQRDTDKMGWE